MAIFGETLVIANIFNKNVKKVIATTTYPIPNQISVGKFQEVLVKSDMPIGNNTMEPNKKTHFRLFS